MSTTILHGLYSGIRYAYRGAVLLCFVAAQSVAQSGSGGPYRAEIGEYTLIYSAVRSDALPAEMARRHGLPERANAVLVNVTVQRDGDNIPAQISAAATNLAQQRREIDIEESVANGFVSYIGVVDIANREVLDFEIQVLPEGASSPLEISFREEFLPQPRTPPAR